MPSCHSKYAVSLERCLRLDKVGVVCNHSRSWQTRAYGVRLSALCLPEGYVFVKFGTGIFHLEMMRGSRITTYAAPSELQPTWQVVDAAEERLGRLASRVAATLMGKHRPVYSPHLWAGDAVVVVNADRVRVTGRPLGMKLYQWHTGYIGHLKSVPQQQMLATNPERVIRLAVRGMLPRNRLGRRMLRRLRVYAGPEHPHEAQVRAGAGARPRTRALGRGRRREGVAEGTAGGQPAARDAPLRPADRSPQKRRSSRPPTQGRGAGRSTRPRQAEGA